MKSKARALILFGPTAVGKTTLLFNLWRDRAEVISADSMQIYRGMDIGTAAPTAEETRLLPHHLIGQRDPREQYTAGDFVKAAEALLPAVAARGRIPIVSGGTAFYIKCLLYGLPGTPAADPALRLRIVEDIRSRGRQAVYEELKRLDPLAASRIAPNDLHRLARAFEVIMSAGTPLSALPVPDQPRPDIDFLVIGLERPRTELNRLIDERIDGMLARGLRAEVAGLMEAGYGADDPGMRAIGYREFFLWKSRPCMPAGEVAALMKQNSRRYAKRQMTFFRSLRAVHWFHPAEESAISALVDGFFS